MGGIKSEKENLNTCKHISGVSSYTSICKLLGVDAFIYRIYTNRIMELESLPFYDVYVDLKKSVKESWRLMEKYIREKSA